MPLILVTNDDGVFSPGIEALYETMKALGDAIVVAPDRHVSAAGHSLTMCRPLMVNKIRENVYCIDGTPTDCVTIALGKILDRQPDLVVSGINEGGNLGDDVTYSGTVAAAIEGAIMGIPSIAFSLVCSSDFDFTVAAEFSKKVAAKVLKSGLPKDTFLNVNIPKLDKEKIKGIKFTHQGRRIYRDSIRDHYDLKGKKHYWIGGGKASWNDGNDTDFMAVESGYVSITPLQLDLTNYDTIDFLRENWRNQF